MRIELANLEGGKGQFAHSYGAGELSLDDDRVKILEGPEVSGSIRLDGQRVKLNGNVKGRLQVECDRCLKPVEMAVDSSFKLDYMRVAEYRAQQTDELGAEDLDVVVFEGEAIDVDALVAEELLLAVPDHVLCKEDCKGICPACGADRNSVECSCENHKFDPRWAGLKELVNGK